MTRLSITLLLAAILAGGCSDGGDDSDTAAAPPTQPPTQPPVTPPEPPSSESFSVFVRDVFNQPANSEPLQVNERILRQDAQDDEFEDLLR